MRRAAAAAVCMAGIATAQGQQTPAEAWRQAAEALKRQPGLVRFYSFKSAAAVHTNLAAAAAEMRLKAGAAPTAEVGRVAGSSALVLDSGVLESRPLPLPTNAFTVLVWLRPLGLGSQSGNAGSANGMIASSGSGYYDGWRLAVYDWASRRPSLDLGREKGAFSVRAEDGLSAGFWNHLAATWDGARVRLYLNGMLSAEKPFAGPAVAPSSGLRVGFSGYGVGALRMAVDELAVLDRALPAEEVAACALTEAAPPSALRPRLAQAQAAAASGDRAAATAAFRALAVAPDAPPPWRLWARLAAARLTSDHTALAALFEDPAAPAHLRGQAAALLAQAGLEGAQLPSRVLAKLPELLELNAGEQRRFGLALGDAYGREGNADAAAGVFDHLLTLCADVPLEASELRQRYCRALRQAGRFDAARKQAEALANDTRMPAYARGIGALTAARLWQEEGKLAEAESAFLAAAARTNLLAHLTAEAEACAAECANLRAGKPARDPEASRQRPRPLPAPALTFFVAPNGDDRNAGTQRRPFASLERARDAVRSAKRGGALPPGGAAVFLRGGRYAVTNTFELGPADSGSLGAPVVYRAWADEKPVLDGGFRVRGLRRVSDPAVLARLPPEARDTVRVADLRAQGYTALGPQKSYGYGLNNATVRELFEDGAPLQPARWPNAGTVQTGEVRDPTNLVFACASDRLARWTSAPDLMACGYWHHLWAGSTVPVAAADPAAGTLRLGEKPNYGVLKEHPFYVLNLLEELDQPGEWYLDRKAGLLYVWPRKNTWFSELTLSRWDKPFIAVRHANDLVFHGLTLEYGQQHGLTLEACVNTAVSGCVIRRLGGTALTALRCANLKVYGNRLHTLGHTGMHVSGGNRKNLTSGQIVIENNDVGFFGRCSRTYNPALLLEGCGTRVAHNRFHDAPSSAMRIEGNDHLIEFNQVDRVVQESDDQGGIDMWGNPSYRGVVIRFNRWQEIGGGAAPCGQAGIRFDDAISGMLVYGNLFDRASNGHFGGVQIHGGQKNIIDNNVFVGCRYGVSFSTWSQTRWLEFLKSERVTELMVTDVNIMLPPYSTRYPELRELGGPANVNSLWRNLFVGCEQSLYRAPNLLDTCGNLAVSGAADGASALARSPFRPLPLEEIGLYEDPARAAE